MHAIDTADILRRSSVAHVIGASKTLQTCIAISVNTWVGKVDDTVVCAWGLVPPSLLSDRAYLWMIHTTEVEQHRFLFVRNSQIAVGQMLEKFKVLYGHVDAKSPKSIRWLKWLGATFGEPDGLMIPFQIRAKHG